jgi:hypothetical protein
MFDSVLIDVAIGLVVMFFFLALASSSIVEAIAGVLKVRSKNLERGIKALIDDPQLVYDTSVFAALTKSSTPARKQPTAGAAVPPPTGAAAPAADATATTTKKKSRPPSYMSSRAFADAVVEGIARLKSGVRTAEDLEAALPANLRARLDAITNEVGDDIVKIKARLEDWFDDAMDRVSGVFKRWSQIWLFVIGLVLTIAVNASAVHVAATLWQQPAAREAAVQVAKRTTNATRDDDATVSEHVQDASDAISQLKASQLPLGWKDWDTPGGTAGTVLGWLLTAFLILLGAPFWYGILTKLVSLRSSGNPPPKAVDDPASATRIDAARTTAERASPTPTPTSLATALDSNAFGPFAPATTA